MKRLKAEKGIECMNCAGCVTVCAETYFKTSNPDYALLRLDPMKNDPKEVFPTTCIQCGKCAKACPNGAITQNAKGVYMVNKKACTGCGSCVEACPFHVMLMPEGSATAFKCIACGKCVAQCPMDILSIFEK